MRLRALYGDWTEWEGTVYEWPDSPDKPLLIALGFARPPYRIFIGGTDHSALKAENNTLHLWQWEDSADFAVYDRYDLTTFENTHTHIRKHAIPKDVPVRSGVLLADDEWDRAVALAYEWPDE